VFVCERVYLLSVKPRISISGQNIMVTAAKKCVFIVSYRIVYYVFSGARRIAALRMSATVRQCS